ncbi:MAG: adenylosuccinate synthase [Gemmatimonadales bacterium]
MFGPSRKCLVVVGAQWGDEGKGKIVDVLSESADLVIRYQGGANAGHTVVCDDTEFVLHQIPTGVLQPNTGCVIGNGVVLDPGTFIAELEQIEDRGIDLSDRLVVSDRAHLVLPYHILMDRACERMQKIGTTGRGIGPSYEDKFGRRGIRTGDLRNLRRATELVLDGVERTNRLLQLMESAERADPTEHTELLERVAPRLMPLVADTGLIAYESLVAGRHVLLEGAQGSLLDVDHGTYPYVTSSNTTAGSAAVGVGIGPTMIDAVLGVVKAYSTRVGNGPLPTELTGDTGGWLRELGGEYGATTGRARRCGWFDAVIVRYAARVNGLTNLAITKLDVLDTIPRIPVCIGYRVAGDVIREVPADIETLNRVDPVYEELEGWLEQTSDVRSFEDLPTNAVAYIKYLEEQLGVPVSYVSVGTRREQIIAVAQP